MLGGQRGSEIRITLAQARQNLLLHLGRQLAIRCAGLVIRELEHHPRARESAAASAARSVTFSAPLQLSAKDAFATPRATLSIGPVLVGSNRFAPFP